MKKTLINWAPLVALPFSINSSAEEPKQNVSTSIPESVLTLESMAVTAKVVDAKLNGIDIKQLPLASTVINQEEIKRLKYVDPDELLDRIPGETLVRNLRIPDGAKSYTIPLIDGAALGSPLSGATQDFGTDINSQDIERIEIFKGPVSALYPNNAFGGVINVVSKGSTQLPEQNTRIWAEAGNYDRYRGGGSTQGELGGVGYILDYSGWNLSAYRDQGELNTGRIIEIGEERQQASAKFIFHPDEVSSLILRGSYLNDHLAEPGEILENDFDLDDKGIGRNTASFSDEESFTGSAIYNRDFTESDHFDANFNFKYIDESGFSRFSGPIEDEDIEINGKASYKHDFDFLDANIILGTYVFYGIEDDFNPSDRSKDFATTGIYSGFAQVQFSPIENLQVTAGVRHESIELDHKNTTAGGVRSPNSETFSATLPKAGVNYNFFDSHNVWFAYGQGFLVPTAGQLYTSRFANPDLDPEEAEHFEVGLRGSLPIFDRDLTYETSYYHQNISNYIVAANLNNTTQTQNLNAGKVNIEGVETVIEYQPYDFIRFGITHSFQHNIYKKFVDSNGVDLSGEELDRSPEHHINGRVAIMPLEGLAIELGIDSITSYSTTDQTSSRVSSRGNVVNNFDPKGRFDREERINLRVTYDKGPYELWFHALNIGDVKEDRVGFNIPRGPGVAQRSIRTVDGLQLYGGIAYNF